MPMFSFVVIAYNDELYIKDCLSSIQSQTYHDIEVIVVDDCSSDNTAAIIAKIIDGDSRFRLVRRRQNAGAHIARMTGVRETHGEHVIFVDGDDRVQSDLCEQLNRKYETIQPDILRFGIHVIPLHASDEFTKALESSFNADFDYRAGKEIMLSVFSDSYGTRDTWSVVDRSFAGNFVRESFAMMTAQPLGRMEDAYEFFVLSDRAQSMGALKGYKGLLYSYGTGLSGNGIQSLTRFNEGQRGIHGSLAALLRYAESRKDPVVAQCAQWMRRTVLSIVGRDWAGRLSMSDQIAAFSKIRETWGETETAYIISEPLYARAQWVLKDGGYPDYEDPLVQWEILLNSLQNYHDDDELITRKIEKCRQLCTAIESKEDSKKRDIVLAWDAAAKHAQSMRAAMRLNEIREAEATRTVGGKIRHSRIARKLRSVVFPAGSKRERAARMVSKLHSVYSSGMWRGYDARTLFTKGRSVIKRMFG